MFGSAENPTRITWEGNGRFDLPADTIYVGPPSRWAPPWPRKQYSPEEIVQRYETYVRGAIEAGELDISELVGYNLACRCPQGVPCHVDVLLRLANQDRERLEATRRRFVESAEAMVAAAGPLHELAQKAVLGKLALDKIQRGLRGDLATMCRLAHAVNGGLVMQRPTPPRPAITGESIRRALEAEGVVFDDRRGRQTQTTGPVSLNALMVVLNRFAG